MNIAAAPRERAHVGKPVVAAATSRTSARNVGLHAVPRTRGNRCTHRPSRTTASRAAAAAPIRRSALPGKRRLVTSQAVTVPPKATPAPTSDDERDRVGDESGQYRCREMRADTVRGPARVPGRARRSRAARRAPPAPPATATSGERLRIASARALQRAVPPIARRREIRSTATCSRL